MKHTAGTEFYGKGMDSKPGYPNKKHAKELHDLLTKRSTSVNLVKCKDDEDE